jgi:hypothetical protein
MALVNPNIAMSYKPTTEYQPRNALADYAQIQQIKSGQQQAEMASMEMQEYKRKKDTLARIRDAMVRSGGPSDPRAGAMEMMKDPEYYEQGKRILDQINDTEKLDQYFAGQAGGKLSAAQPAANALAPNVPATPMMPGTLGSGTFDIAPPPAANALAPTAAPVANALAPAAPMDEVTQLEADIARLSGNTNPRAIAIVANLEKRLAKLQPFAVGPNIYDPVTKTFITGPKERQSQLLTSDEEAQKLRIARESRTPRAERAPRTQVTQLADGSIALVNLDTGQIVPAAMDGQPVQAKGATDAKVSEQQASYNVSRILSAANQIAGVTSKNESANKPGVLEAAAGSVGLSGTANLARSGDRQVVYGAQRDALDAMLYLATGAAYNKEQLEGITQSYIPAFTDTTQSIDAKRQRWIDLIEAAKIRSGKSWSPKLEQSLQQVIPVLSTSSSKKPAGRGILPTAPGGAPANIDALLDKYK